MSTTSIPARLPVGRLLVLAGAVFASMSSEFLPTGVLPQIARDLRVSESSVGALVTVFALTVVISTVPLTHLTRSIGRKPLMVAMLLGLAASNLVCAVANDYAVLAVARVAGGLFHGLFWAVTGPYASRMVRSDQLTRALSITNLGGTVAFVLGIPLATALGAAVGWRASFAAMGGTILVCAVLVAVLLPAVEHRVPLTTAEIALGARRDPTLSPVIGLMVVTLLLAGGHFALYTYIAPWLISVARVGASGVSFALFVFGVAGGLGLVVVAVLGDRWPRGSFVAACIGVLVAAVLLALLGGLGGVPPYLALIVWSIVYSAWASLAGARILHTASPRLRDLASAMNAVTFNIAIGGGALLGGIVLDRMSAVALPWTYAALAAVAAVVAVTVTLWLPARRRRMLEHAAC